MALVLNSQNVFDYLTEREIYSNLDQEIATVKPITAKNFNLLVTLPENRQLLVKQERQNQNGETAGEFLGEWRIQELLQSFPDLDSLVAYVPELVHFDPQNSILIVNYLDDYRDLADFYAKENIFPPAIAASLGTILATIHRTTFENSAYQEFLNQTSNVSPANSLSEIRQLERITPEVFGMVPADGLKFFALYQRYDSLGQAIAELASQFTPSCLTHNDLKLNNILLSKAWEQSEQNLVRLIDWERSGWGDPAFDLGMLIGSYVQIWLGSLVISKSLTIEESLRLAMTPLELLQPSIAALSLAYFKTFPQISEDRPDFLKIVVQSIGFALITQIQAMIQYEKSFDNMGIAMLQVAKSLLCRPSQSIPTIFGTAAAELSQMSMIVI